MFTGQLPKNNLETTPKYIHIKYIQIKYIVDIINEFMSI